MDGDATAHRLFLLVVSKSLKKPNQYEKDSRIWQQAERLWAFVRAFHTNRPIQRLLNVYLFK